VYYLGHPDTGLIITGYIGSFLLAGTFLAIGSFFSAITKNQVVSFILSGAAGGSLVYAGMPTTVNYLSPMLPANVVALIEMMSIQSHFDSILRGVLEVKDIAYFIILIVAWIGACTVVLEERKAA
jgi:ABC-2 type transport system permease protein